MFVREDSSIKPRVLPLSLRHYHEGAPEGNWNNLHHDPLKGKPCNERPVQETRELYIICVYNLFRVWKNSFFNKAHGLVQQKERDRRYNKMTHLFYPKP